MERDLRGMTIAGRYRIERLLARGGMGTTYVAVDERAFERRVVIKVPDALRSDDARARFVNEARQIVGLEHPHIVTALDVGTIDDDDTTPFIAMAYKGGGDLGQRIAASGGVQSPQEVASWLTDIADALDVVHEHHVLHRDVKPGNILFDRPGPNAEPFLADFGIAKALEGEMMVHTHTGEHLGSPKYMPPETWFGTPGPAFDQYSLACVAFEALAGTLPHTADNALALAMEKNAKPARPLTDVAPHVPAAAAAALMRGLDRDPAQRFQSCSELARAFVGGLTAPANQARSATSAESAAVPPPTGPAGAAHIGKPPDGRSTPPDGATLDVKDFIDARPVGSSHPRVLLLCGALLFVVGYDTQAFASVVPAIARGFGLDRATVRDVFIGGQLGLMCGALLLGSLADRLGRKRVILISTIAFGVCTLATVGVRGATSLLGLEFLTGVGLGGALPSAIALTADFSSRRRRATIVMAMLCGLPVGTALGGVIAAALFQSFGWHAVFVAGGVLPLVLLPILAVSLPESVLEGRDAGTPMKQHMFSAGHGAVTLLFWAILSANLMSLSMLSNGLPIVLRETQHASAATLALILGLPSAGGIAGALVLGPLIDRRSFRALGLMYLGAALLVGATGYAGSWTLASALVVFCTGFCLVGSEIAATALAAIYYPAPMRATGVGWMLGIGRTGAIAASIIAGPLLSERIPGELFFLAAAIPVVGASLAAFAISRLTAVVDRTESHGVAAAG
jgi:AAHS family 4-hydroxybenzoate transporter-like MFS transporter